MRRETASIDRILLLIVGGGLVFLFAWFQWKVLFLAFAGLLFSILLGGVAGWVWQRTRLRPVVAYLLTLLTLMAIVTTVGLLLAPRVISQTSQAAAVLPQSIATATAYLHRTPWGDPVLRLLQKAMQGNTIRLTSLAKDMVEGLVDLVVVLVIGFFGALNPRVYHEGLLLLVPAPRRAQARVLSEEVLSTLRSWLLGQMIPMAVLGLCSMLGLWILGVPLAFTMGLLTGVLIFVPYVGSISSGLLAIALALQRSPHTALYVFILYCIFHLIEGYLLTPFVQKRAVRLPPILTILAQFCLWSFAGILGVAIAAPLAAVVLVLVKRLYLNAEGDRPYALPANRSAQLHPLP